MALIGELTELVHHPGLCALWVVTRDTERARELIGRLEADAAHIERQTIRIALQNAGRLVAVLFEDARGQRGRRAVRLEQQHDVADRALRGPGLLDLLDAPLADAADLTQPLRVFVQYRQARKAEGRNDALGEAWPDPVDQARTEVLLETGQRARRDRHQCLDAKLFTVLRVLDELPSDTHARAGANGGERAHRGHGAATRASTFERPDADHPEARRLIFVGDALDFTGQGGGHARTLARLPR